MKNSLTARQLDQIPPRILDIDMEAELGPRELTGAYYTRGRDEGLREGHQRGRLEEARRLLHRVLARRDLHLDTATRTRIDACDDSTLLERWLDAALTARDITEVFEPAR